MINPTGYTALDLVGFTDRGTYASNVNYVKNDIVHYGGNLWKCKIDDTMNVTPAEGNNWTVFVGEPTNLVERIIAPLEENPATVAYATGRQIIYDDWLWEVIDDIAVGDALIDYDVDPTNANIKKADPVETQLLDIKAKVGPLASLATTIKNSIVAAINEIVGKIGNLSLLDTTDKTSAVNAINEVNTKVSKTEDLISIVENGNTCTHTGGISKGQYVNWKGDLYTADSNISVGVTFASSGGSKNLTAVVDGGLNESRFQLRASGTTNSSLFTAVSSLTTEQFLNARIVIDDSNVYSPLSLDGHQFHYISSSNNSSIMYVERYVSNSALMKLTKNTDGSRTSESQTVTKWELYY